MKAIWGFSFGKRPSLTIEYENPVTKGQVEGGGRRPEEEDMKQLEFKKTIGICPECGHHVRVNKNGNVGSHKVGVTEPTYCPGNGERPLKIVAQYDY